MAWWITTKLLLLRQKARSLHIKNRLNGELGHRTANMADPRGLQCTIIGAKIFTLVYINFQRKDS
jgi:hypothetical protein